MNDFDFFAGSWNVLNRRLVKPLTGSTEWEEFPGFSRASTHFSGGASFDEITFPTKQWAGLTLRLFNPDTGLWTIHWSSSARGVLDPPMVGSFSGGRGEFHGEDPFEGGTVPCRFLWTVDGPDACRWEQAYARDGETWETNWIMEFTRA
ncbi:hypothetical protein [Nonomuraea rhizosphaerae]|uniref:hypothetical protein n=1 Tax=Nonomuraea rhizosphaerae TaxID=2665663 RepID=UPI001C5ED290|nr:hypothetical protein [Nonomuraea rhizosphaerae]